MEDRLAGKMEATTSRVKTRWKIKDKDGRERDD